MAASLLSSRERRRTADQQVNAPFFRLFSFGETRLAKTSKKSISKTKIEMSGAAVSSFSSQLSHFRDETPSAVTSRYNDTGNVDDDDDDTLVTPFERETEIIMGFIFLVFAITGTRDHC
jgi:hypothetical protein